MNSFVRSLSLLASVGLALSACAKQEEASETARPALTVTVESAHETPMTQLVTVNGSVAAWEELPVGAEANGLAIVAVLVEEGDKVAKGQLLVRLNDTVLQAQLKQQEANLEAARAAYVEADANLKRARELKAQGAISAQTEDARVSAARTAAANLVMREAAKAETAARLAQTRIVAPAGGYVSSRSAVIGQIVSAGAELFRIVREGQLEMQAEVPESQLPRIRPGQSASVAADGVPAAEGSVRLVSPSVDPHTRLGMVYITLPKDSAFRTGMFSRAEIAVDSNQAVVVPQNAIVYREGRAGSFVLGADDSVTFKPVKTGVRAGEIVEIVNGLNAGERVIVDGAGFLEDGDRVEVAGARSEKQSLTLAR